MQADEIREFAYQSYVQPAREQGETRVSIRAGDVHKAMGLANRMPAVCSALGANKFESEYGLRRIAREGPANGPNCVLTFEILG